MNEDMAWNEFEKTGSIDSYLKYSNMKKANKYKEEFGKIEGDCIEVIQSKGDSNKRSSI